MKYVKIQKKTLIKAFDTSFNNILNQNLRI